MTATPRRPGDALLHLVDRVARRSILPAEIRALRDGVAALAASNAELASLSVNAARALADERRHHEIAAEECARLRAERDRLRAAVEAVRRLHRPVDGVGWAAPGVYGEVTPACSACGRDDEYAVRWPCPTVRALPADQTTEEPSR